VPETKFITILPTLGDEAEGKEHCATMAWDQAVQIAELQEVELGSEEFEQIWKYLSERWENIAHHIGYIQSNALKVLYELMATGHLDLVDESQTPETITGNLMEMGQVIAAGMISMYTTEHLMWVCNHHYDSVPAEYRSSTFAVTLEGTDDDD
jgi:hypothetical protein